MHSTFYLITKSPSHLPSTPKLINCVYAETAQLAFFLLCHWSGRFALLLLRSLLAISIVLVSTADAMSTRQHQQQLYLCLFASLPCSPEKAVEKEKLKENFCLLAWRCCFFFGNSSPARHYACLKFHVFRYQTQGESGDTWRGKRLRCSLLDDYIVFVLC